MNPTAPSDQPTTWRPAAVLVVDLVKHSTRKRVDIRRIQKLIEEVFCNTFASLKIDSFLSNYTGDGYVCAFLGDGSVRVIDFINMALPELQRRLMTRDQKLRAGVDFGLLHPRYNELTAAYEHFDDVGIKAARLEQAAQPNQLLCTDTFYNIFSSQYPEVFPNDPITVRTKDRDLVAYEIQPYDYLEIQQSLTDYIYGRVSTTASEPGSEYTRRVLIVDDEVELCKGLAEALQTRLPGCEVVASTNGKEALRLAQSCKFDLVLTDLMMPDMDGITLTEQLLAKDENLVVIMVTGQGTTQTCRDFYDIGGFHYILKPFRVQTILPIIEQAFEKVFPRLFQKLGVFCDEPGKVLSNIERASRRIRQIISTASRESDIGQSLIRHKAKQIVSDFVKTVRPRTDFQTCTELLLIQTKSLKRLADLTHHVTQGKLIQFLDQYFSDLMKRYGALSITLKAEGFSSETSIDSLPETVLVLITCELIDNAVDALSGEGNIDVEVGCLLSTQQLRIMVNDNGPGISSEDVSQIFEPGFSTKGAGRGLGLHLLQEAVHRLNGEVVYSRHKGACFSVLLPLGSAS